MNESPGSKPPSDSCPALDTLRAFASGRLEGDAALEVAAHLYMQRCSRCGELLLAMPETTACALAPPHAEPQERATVDPSLATVNPEPAGNGCQPLRLGRYVIQRQVGKGGFGTVYAARDEELDRLVAVKVPFAHRLNLAEQGQVATEARLHASLDHPNIVPVYDVGHTPDIPFYFVSKLIAGQDLAARIKDRRPDHREAARLVLLLAGALEHMHEKGLVHRDVKPRNVLLDEAGTPYLADFGLAMHPLPAGDGAAEDHLIAGTLAYMSPEQARGDLRHIDGRTDLYALGVLLYELLTGEKPFRGGIVAIRHKILNEAPIPPRSLDATVPRDLEAICLKAMAKDAGQRYQGAGQLAEDLRRYLADEPLLYARDVGFGERAWSWVRHRRGLAAAAGVACAALALAVWLALRSPARPPPPEPEEPTVAATVETDPPGAAVSYFPLDERTGRPLFERVVRGKAGEVVRLPRRHFLVVGVLKGQAGEPDRFHEVFRLIPGSGGITGPWRHRRFKLIDDVIHLHPIKLHPTDVARDMCLFPAGEGVVMALGGPRAAPAGQPAFEVQRLNLPEYYLDPTEVRAGPYTRWLLGEEKAPVNPPADPEVAAASVTWDHAAAYAEWVGKRLPDEAEYEYAGTGCGKSQFPWGDSADPLKGLTWTFGRVGSAEFDVLKLPGRQQVVCGLYSNVAEWTSTWGGQFVVNEPTIPPSMTRVVRGGPSSVVRGEARLKGPPVGPKERFTQVVTMAQAGLGFRCSRSSRPRWNAEDFATVLDR